MFRTDRRNLFAGFFLIQLYLTIVSFEHLLGTSSFAKDQKIHELDDRSFVELIESKYLEKLNPWVRLMKYQPTYLSFGRVSRYQSLVVSHSFFVTENGRNEPMKELREQIRLAHQEPEFSCRFPARYLYFQQVGLVEKSNFEIRNCEHLQKYINEMDFETIDLVFSSYYIENPSSAYGHTFLKLGRKDNQNELLNGAIDFSANTDTDNAFLYAVKGLAGGFLSNFKYLPYYRKIREYNNLESRDLWSFRIPINRSQMERMLLHLWELQHAYYPYYYFSKNCSYHIIDLIDIALESNVIASLKPIVIPIDTLHAIRDQGLVIDTSLREAPIKEFNETIGNLSREDRLFFLDAKSQISENKKLISIPDQTARIDLLTDYMSIKYLKEINQSTTNELSLLYFDLLKKRSKLKKNNVEAKNDQNEAFFEESQSPMSAHGSRRLRLGVNEGETLKFGYRFSLNEVHELTTGYHPQSNLIMGDFEFEIGEDRTFISKVVPLELWVFNSEKTYQTKFGWNIETTHTAVENSKLSQLKGGMGKYFEFGETFIIGLSLQLSLRRVRDHQSYDNQLVVGPAAFLGGRINETFGAKFYLDQMLDFDEEFRFGQNYELNYLYGRDLTLSLSYESLPLLQYTSRLSFNFSYYF